MLFIYRNPKKLSLLYLRGESVEYLKIYGDSTNQADILIPDYLSLVHGCIVIIVKDVEEIPLKFIKNVYYLLKFQRNDDFDHFVDSSSKILALKARERQICCIWFSEREWIKTWNTIKELEMFENRLVFSESIWDKKLMKIVEKNVLVPENTVIDLNKTVGITEKSNIVGSNQKNVEIDRLKEDLQEMKEILGQTLDLNRESSDMYDKWSVNYIDDAYCHEKDRKGLEYRILVDVYENAKTVCEKVCELVLPLLRQSMHVSIIRNSNDKWPDAQFNETPLRQRMLDDARKKVTAKVTETKR